MEVLIGASPDAVAALAAEAVAAALPTHRPAVLGLATGSSPTGLYQLLGDACRTRGVPTAEAYGVALDEYVGLPDGCPQTYRAVLEREVCTVVGMRADRLFVPDGSGQDLEDLVTAAAAFEDVLATLGGVDVQVLGIGTNGHLGFNEPGSALSSRTRVKRLSDRTRADNARFFSSPADVPTHCITQGLGTILDARRLVLVAVGGAKAPAVAAAVEGPLTSSCPGSVIQWHADAVVVVDEAAAARLRNRTYYEASAGGLTPRPQP